MKTVLCWLFTALVPCIAYSQSKINKSYPIKKGQTVAFQFDYPKTIRMSSWDKNEVSVEALVKIGGLTDDSVFSLSSAESSDQLLIKNKIDMSKVPYRYYAVENGIKTSFSTQEELAAFMKEKGSAITSNYQTQDVEIIIDIKLPANTNTLVSSTYGLVEVKDFVGPIKVDATYGGIDAKLNQRSIGKLKMTNRFGKIYTDYDLQPENIKEQRFFTAINASPGKGASYDFSSSFGNIYLRNP